MRNNSSVLSACCVGLFLAGVSGTGCTNYPAPTESHYNRGVELYDQGKHAEAIDEYKLALRKKPGDTFSMYNLAVVYHDQGKHEEAIALYKDILATTEDTNSRINLAAIYYDRGDKELAFSELARAAENNRDSAEPLSVLGEYLERVGSLKEAEAKYLDAIAVDGQHALTHYRLGRLYCKEGKTDPCLEHLEQAAVLMPKVPTYLEALARQKEKQGNKLEAIHLLERVSVLEPDRSEVFAWLGNLYKSEKLYQNAIKRYWSAIAIEDKDPGVHRSLVEIYDRLSEMELKELDKMDGQNSLAKSP